MAYLKILSRTGQKTATIDLKLIGQPFNNQMTREI